jgi:hypothetical protein
MYSATIDIRAGHEAISGLLLDPSAVPEWNPAITRAHTRETQARPGVPYGVTVRSLLRGTLSYAPQHSGLLVEYEMRAPGAVETGSWRLHRVDASTTAVEHSFEHGGFLLSRMGAAFEQVAHWRLSRLKSFTEGYVAAR